MSRALIRVLPQMRGIRGLDFDVGVFFFLILKLITLVSIEISQALLQALKYVSFVHRWVVVMQVQVLCLEIVYISYVHFRKKTKNCLVLSLWPCWNYGKLSICRKSSAFAALEVSGLEKQGQMNWGNQFPVSLARLAPRVSAVGLIVCAPAHQTLLLELYLMWGAQTCSNGRNVILLLLVSALQGVGLVQAIWR